MWRSKLLARCLLARATQAPSGGTVAAAQVAAKLTHSQQACYHAAPSPVSAYLRHRLHGASLHSPFSSSQWGSLRGFASGEDYSEEVEAINSLFVEARDEIEMAHEEAETVYFDESVKSAKDVVDACIGKWEALLQRLPDDERGKLQRSMGLRMEQLKAEFDQVKNLHLEE